MEKKRPIKKTNYSEKATPLIDLLKKGGFLLPMSEEEVDEYDKVFGKTDILLPPEIDSPDFLFNNLSGKTNSEKDFSVLTSALCDGENVKDSTNKPFSKIKSTKNLYKKNDYFKKLVLAAEIANNLHTEPTFGRIKFVKILYLCDQVCQMKLSTNYGKYAAGPFDPKFIFSVEAEFVKREWFAVIKKDNRTKYLPSKKVNGYKTYFSNYFSTQIDSLGHIISLFKEEKTDFCEIVATLYYIWDEELKKGTSITNEVLVGRFYAWSKQKERFAKLQVVGAIEWMKNEHIIPSKRDF
jgi:hypothetical protein